MWLPSVSLTTPLTPFPPDNSAHSLARKLFLAHLHSPRLQKTNKTTKRIRSLSLFTSLTLLEGCVSKLILKQEYMSAFLKQKIKSTIKEAMWLNGLSLGW